LYGLYTNNTKITESYKAASIYKRIIYYNARYNIVVREGGIKLLDGKCQRIAIARAFLKNLKILLLNKAISTIDNIIEKLIRESLKT
jgi:ABC-type multidrug transport system fused ATPase/permease subunit